MGTISSKPRRSRRSPLMQIVESRGSSLHSRVAGMSMAARVARKMCCAVSFTMSSPRVSSGLRRALASENFGIEKRRRTAAFEKGDDVIGGGERHFCARFERAASDVRRQNHIFQSNELRRNFRLEFVNIERSTGDFAGLERFDERSFVHHRAARSIYEVSGRFHLRQSLGVKEMVRTGSERHMQGNKIGLNQNSLEAHKFGGQLGFDFRADSSGIVIESAHAKAFGAARH